MRRVLFLLGLLTLTCTSCAPRYCDTTLYQRSGRQKAIVAVLPVINNVHDKRYCWDLSKEFTDEIRKRIFDSTRVYLLREPGNEALAHKLNVPNPTEIVSDEIKNLGAAEFVLVTELLDQNESADRLKSDGGSLLGMQLRARVIDVRHETPKVIFQEILDQSQVIAHAYMNNDYVKTPWGSEAFRRTPLGMAHQKVVRELVSRVESYVEAAR